MNSPQRITRHLVKALSAGAMLVAAALPMAVATSAGAAGTSPASSYLVLGANQGVLGSNLNAVDATGHATFAQGWSGTGTFVFSSTDAANLTGAAGQVTVTTTAPGVSFSSNTEVVAGTVDTYTGAVSVTTTVSATATAATGYYPVTITDSAGSVTIANAFAVTASPTVTTASPNSVAQGAASTSVTIYGTGFTSTGGLPTVKFVQPAGSVVPTWTTTSVAAGGGSISGTLVDTGGTAGSFNATVTNPDGGSFTTSNALITITGFGAVNVSPSVLATTSATVVTKSIVINGAGFQTGLTLTFAPNALTADTTTPTAAGHYYITSVTPTAITAIVAMTSTVPTSGAENITVTNPASPGNSASATLNGALVFGAGVAPTPAATITSVTTSPTTLPVGTGVGTTSAATMTITGSGFDPVNGNTVAVISDATTAADTAVVPTCTTTSGTSITCTVVVNTNAIAGPDSITVVSASAGTPTVSKSFDNAFTIGGTAIASQSSPIAVGAPIGTQVTLTGTGLTNLTTATVTSGGGTLNGNFIVTSPTTATFVVTASPNATDVTSPAKLAIVQMNSSGLVTKSYFTLKVSAAPTVTGLVHTTTGTDLFGTGGTNIPITITGTNFAAGATIGSFVNSNGTADAGVTATVTSVNTLGTTISATLTIAAGDTNLSLGYKVTNTDGGSYTVLPFSTAAVVIEPGPTITSVSPTTATPNSTVTFTITGTGFSTATPPVVSTTPVNGTCGSATASSTTTLTVACTFGAAGTAAVSLLLTNADGGAATSAAVLAAATPKPPVTVVNLHTTGAHGFAVVGKTVTITITGGGFYGQPTLTSTAPGVKAIVVKDNGKMLTVRVTVRAGAARGWHTFTIRLANGKMAKVNYLTK